MTEFTGWPLRDAPLWSQQSKVSSGRSLEFCLERVERRREVEPQGFTYKNSLEFLPWQHVIIFEKPALDEEKVAANPTAKPVSPTP